MIWILFFLTDTIMPEKYRYTGPFLVGAREGITGIVEEPEYPESLPSIFLSGGKAHWYETSPDSTGWVKLTFDDVLWDTILHYWGISGVIISSYVRAEVDIPEDGWYFLVTSRLGSVKIDDKRYPGEPYSRNYFFYPVYLTRGKHKISLRTGGFVSPRFKLMLVKGREGIFILNDPTLPDLIEGDTVLYAGIPVLNGKKTHEKFYLKWKGRDIKPDSVKLSLLSGEVRKVPITLKILSLPDSLCTLKVWTPSDTHDFLLFHKKKGPVKRTFISEIDSSCQYYAVLFPRDYNPEKTYALIFSLHGAGVEAYGLAGAYSPLDWAFVACPTNRRPFGFDWQDWGRLDAMEVLSEVIKNFPVDTNHICLTGHSMGGHGTWHVGVTHFDRFACMAPGAGWITFQLYIPWFLRRDEIFAPPSIHVIRRRALYPDNTISYIDNLLHVPVYIIHGEMDDNVPPYHGRTFYRELSRLGYKVIYHEFPGKKHWWKGCVDFPEVLDFFKNARRNPYPEHVIFHFSDLQNNSRAYWIRVHAQEIPFEDSRMEAEVLRDRIEVKTKNIKSFTLKLHESIWRNKVVVDGKEFKIKEREISFVKKGRKWRKGKEEDRYRGPIKRAYYSPFILVYGTGKYGEIAREQAMLQSFVWYRRANGYTRVLPDTLVTKDMLKKYNLILFGGPVTNKIVKRFEKKLPVRFRKDEAYVFVWKNPENPEKLVLVYAGGTEELQRLATFFHPLYSGSGLPDYVIFDERVKLYGFGGVKEAGFFEW